MDDLETMLDACESANNIPEHNGGPGFSQWEQEFLESVRDQYDNRSYLSVKQTETLQGMYDRT